MAVGGVSGNSPNNNMIVSKAMDDARSKVSGDDFGSRLETAMANNDEKELKKACKEFEGVFLNMMYKQMKATIPKSELIPGDAGREIFESMLDDTLMEQASKGTGTGLADIMYKQLSKQLKEKDQQTKEGDAQVVKEE